MSGKKCQEIDYFLKCILFLGISPAACNWVQTPPACAVGKCKNLWRGSGAGFLLQVERLGWGAEHSPVVLKCRGLGARLDQVRDYRRSTANWAGVCRNKPAAGINKLTARIPPSTEWNRRRWKSSSKLQSENYYIILDPDWACRHFLLHFLHTI